MSYVIWTDSSFHQPRRIAEVMQSFAQGSGPPSPECGGVSSGRAHGRGSIGLVGSLLGSGGGGGGGGGGSIAAAG